MVGRLAGASLLGVVGPSGSGKSSAVRAGLVPALAAGALPGSQGWIRATMRPGAYPLRSLDRAVWAALPEAVRVRLEGSELPLRAVRDHLGEDERIVLAVDQFEELFTQTADEDEREAFVRAIVEAADDPRGGAIVISAIRSDFYGRCASYPALAALLGASHVLVGPMSPEEYRRAIEEPARRAGLIVEPALTEALIHDVRDQPGALPLLSTALLELWHKRDGRTLSLAAFGETGGVRGAVGRLADETFEHLDDDEQQAARAVMLRLAGPGEGDAVVRRRVALADLDADRNERVGSVLDAFTAARLLTVGEGTVEVAHEALLREWPRLVGWLDEDRAGIKLRGHVGVAAAEWEAAGRDPGELYRGARLAAAMDWTADHAIELNDLERAFLQESREASELAATRQRRANRRLRGLLAGVAVLLVLALVAGVVAVGQRQKAASAAITATAARVGAQAVIEDDLDTSLLLAAQARDLDDSLDTRSALLASILRAPGAIAVLPATEGRTNEVVGAADGSTFVTLDNADTIGIYDTRTMALERTVEAPGLGVGDVSRDGSAVLGRFAGDKGAAYAWIDIADGTLNEVPVGDQRSPAGQVAFDPDGRSFVAIEWAGDRLLVVRRSFPDMEEIDSEPIGLAPPSGTDGEIRVERALESDRIFVDGEAGLAVVDAGSLREVRTLEDVHFPFSPSPDGRVVGFGRGDGSVAFVDVGTGAITEADGRHDASVNRVSFAPDGETFVTTGDDREVIVWDASTRSIREVLTGHAGRVFGTAFDAEAATAFTGGLDGRVIAWDLTTERRIGRRFTFAAEDDLCCPEPGFDITPVASPDGTLLAFADARGRVRMTDVETGATLWRADPWSDERMEQLLELESIAPEFVTGLVTHVAFSPDGTTMAVGGGNQEAVLYDTASGEERQRILASRLGWVNDVSFTPDGRLVTANDDGRVVVWDAAGEPAEEYRILPAATSTEDYPGPVIEAAPSPDGRFMAVIAYDLSAGEAPAFVFNRTSGDLLWRERADAYGGSLGWSADSGSLGIGTQQTGELTIRDGRTGAMLGQPIPASAGFVLTVGFSQARSMWVTSGTDGTVRLFDAETLKQVGFNILADDNRWTTATVVGGGDAMVVASDAGHAWRWDLNPDRWTEQACIVAGRSLTPDEWRQALGDLPYDPYC
jgi:WD40 repeat protein